MPSARDLAALPTRLEEQVRFESTGRDYVALPGPKTQKAIRFPVKTSVRRFLTVVPTDPAKTWSKDEFSKFCSDHIHDDDVCNPEFSRILVFSGFAEGTIRLSKQLKDWLEAEQRQFMVIELCKSSGHRKDASRMYSRVPLPAGPHLWTNRRLLPIFRLYPDTNRTCVEAFQVAEKMKPLRILTSELFQRSDLCLAVPCRWYSGFLLDSSHFLRGKRILVKDIFDIRGLRISACSRDYLELAEPALETAPAIQRLIDYGSVIVGKTKLSSLISREEPSENIFVEYVVPENPRGDGMQSPAGSSSGSAAAVAAYEWLDFAVGSDSTGSTRRPAMVNGCFGIRLSPNALPSRGMMPCFPIFDAFSVFSRGIVGLKPFVENWCQQSLHYQGNAPTSIIVIDEYPIADRRQQRLFNDFVDDFASVVKIPVAKLSLRQLWKRSRPAGCSELPLYEYLADVGRLSFFYDFAKCTDEFRKRYEAEHHVRPAANRMTAWRWDQAENITQDERDEAVRRLEVYGEWMWKSLLGDKNPVVLLPVGDVKPNYRDAGCDIPLQAPDAWDQLWMAPILKAPEITVPIGQIPFHSRISNREELLPVAASVMGMPGTDLDLIATVQEVLAKSSRPLQVAAGRQMFDNDWEFVGKGALRGQNRHQ